MTTPSKQSNTGANRRARRIFGTAIRRSGEKTVAVQAATIRSHSLYQKGAKQSQVYLAHDPNNTVRLGDQVTIIEHRPLSRRKRWMVITP
jgi:small subunit ribosomal protein S17